MRIIGGEVKGRRLKSPKGLKIRPTADRVREAIFNIIRIDTDSCTVLDLFAGCGTLGLEALSRGGRECIFVENDPRHKKILEMNIRICGFEDRVSVIRMDVRNCFRALARLKKGFDLVFMDPPYGYGKIAMILEKLNFHDLLREGALVVLEHGSKEAVPDKANWGLWDRRLYGQTCISFFKPK